MQERRYSIANGLDLRLSCPTHRNDLAILFSFILFRDNVNKCADGVSNTGACLGIGIEHLILQSKLICGEPT